MAFMDIESRDVSILNGDCWESIFDYLDIDEVLRLREVCKTWRDRVQRYLQGVYGYIIFMPGSSVNISHKKSRFLTLTSPRNLRHMLQSFGENLTRVTTNGDNQWLEEMAGNCPQLKEITVYHCFWNAELLGLLNSCEQLERVTLRRAKWVEDEFTYNLNNIKHIEIDGNECITGSFLAYARRPLESVSLRECPMLQGYQLGRNLHSIRSLKKLELDECQPEILASARRLVLGLPQLQELSLSHYSNARDHIEGLAECISQLVDLRRLRLRRNDAVNDQFLTTVAQGCRRLDSLDVSGCNGTNIFKGVTDAGVSSIAKNKTLVSVDVSSLHALTDAGIEALHATPGQPCPLEILRASNDEIAEKTFYRCFRACTDLKLLDVRACGSVTSNLVLEMSRVAPARVQPLTLLAAATSFQYHGLIIRRKGLTVRLDWPLDEPWERYHNNPEPDFQNFEDYVIMD